MLPLILGAFLFCSRLQESPLDVPPAVCLGTPPGFMPNKPARRQKRRRK